jgi:hypothetical protein
MQNPKIACLYSHGWMGAAASSNAMFLFSNLVKDSLGVTSNQKTYIYMPGDADNAGGDDNDNNGGSWWH